MEVVRFVQTKFSLKLIRMSLPMLDAPFAVHPRRNMSIIYLYSAVMLLLVGQTVGEEGRSDPVPKNLIQDGVCAVGDLVTEFSGGCLHGQNCGGACAPYMNVSVPFCALEQRQTRHHETYTLLSVLHFHSMGPKIGTMTSTMLASCTTNVCALERPTRSF